MTTPQTDQQAAAYASVREQLTDEGYGDMVMRTPIEIRDALAQLQADAQRQERLYRDLLSELDDADDADDEASLDSCP